MNVDNISLPPEIWREIIKLATFLTYFDLIENPIDWPDSVMSKPSAEYWEYCIITTVGSSQITVSRELNLFSSDSHEIFRPVNQKFQALVAAHHCFATTEAKNSKNEPKVSHSNDREPTVVMIQYLNTRMSLKLTSRSFSTIVDEFPIDVIWIYGTEQAYRLDEELRRRLTASHGMSASPAGSDETSESDKQPRRLRIRHLFLHQKMTHRHNPYDGPHYDLHNLYARIFQYCTDLSGFIYVNMTTTSFSGGLANAIADKFPRQLRYIHWNALFLAGSTSRFFHRVAHSLRAFRADRAQTSGSLRTGVSLPALTHIDMSSTDLGLNWMVQWKLPSITHIAIGDIGPNLCEFLASVNRTLISVRFVRMETSAPFREVLAVAPNLQELSYYVSDAHKHLSSSRYWTSDLCHQSLQHLTITFMTYSRSSLLEYVRPINKLHFTKLQTVRIELRPFYGDPHFHSTVAEFLLENLDMSNHPISITTR